MSSYSDKPRNLTAEDLTQEPMWRIMNRKFRKQGFQEPKIKDAEELWTLAQEWMEYMIANPLKEEVIQGTKDGPVHETLNKMRAMTIYSLCCYLGITMTTWHEYRKRPELADTCKRIDYLIYCQKFEGGAAGLLNANIVTRDLGLADKTVLEGGATPLKTIHSEMTPKEAADAYQATLDPDKE